MNSLTQKTLPVQHGNSCEMKYSGSQSICSGIRHVVLSSHSPLFSMIKPPSRPHQHPWGTSSSTSRCQNHTPFIRKQFVQSYRNRYCNTDCTRFGHYTSHICVLFQYLLTLFPVLSVGCRKSIFHTVLIHFWMSRYWNTNSSVSIKSTNQHRLVIVISVWLIISIYHCFGIIRESGI